MRKNIQKSTCVSLLSSFKNIEGQSQHSRCSGWSNWKCYQPSDINITGYAVGFRWETSNAIYWFLDFFKIIIRISTGRRERLKESDYFLIKVVQRNRAAWESDN